MRQWKVLLQKWLKNSVKQVSVLDKNRNRQKSMLTPEISALKWMDIISNTYFKYRLVVLHNML
jgi:hypothetical protein